ncbi:hypothetical protein [Loktanella sp. SALINAS62]|uniref:hypothetical protein n=1 Tax=Loktanella sp. SALINAS62 TaxID=2706124 RepID=UPI001B8C8CBA|nr:hypothetical protein [Loktanella sp. SALINAS62]MBS1303719.1 hypothetical protein [Loktanella sp. SALINAS62]
MKKLTAAIGPGLIGTVAFVLHVEMNNGGMPAADRSCPRDVENSNVYWMRRDDALIMMSAKRPRPRGRHCGLAKAQSTCFGPFTDQVFRIERPA